MEILQHYYTSFVNQETGSAGFQVKAMSPGINHAAQTMISRLIAYRIPLSLDERAIATHPLALRYYPFNEHESLLICSQSSGSDPNGRPGNFFAHTLVADPQLFTTIPPVLYWRSEFWRGEDAEARSQLETLSDLGDPALDIDSMWAFLREGQRVEQFYRLLCAVVHGVSSRHRIIIIDSDEHVALWIAAVSCMLPPAYRPLLSFTTYHHDPYQSQFFITGTPSSPQLRFTPEDYISYFILDTRENKISSVADSFYATLARQYATPEAYDNEMLTFFSRYALHFPVPTAIDEQLDAIVLYAQIMQQEKSSAFTSEAAQTIGQVLTTFEQMNYYEAQDISDLKQLTNFLWSVYEASDNIEADQLRNRIITLLEHHKVPTDEEFERDIQGYTARLFGDYSSNRAEIALQRIEQLRLKYGDENFIDQVNRRDYLLTLSTLVTQKPTLLNLTRAWQAVGLYLLPGTETGSVLVKSILAWGQARNRGEKSLLPVAQKLFSALHTAIAKRPAVWLNLLVALARQDEQFFNTPYLEQFYCKLVFALSLEKRAQFRAILQPLIPNLIDSEFNYDLSKATLQTMLSVIKKWISYVQQTELREPEVLVAQGLTQLHTRCNDEQWGAIARECLLDTQIAQALGSWKARLFADAFAQISLSQFLPEHLPLYEMYRHHPELTGRSRCILNAILAMHERHLDAQLTAQLYEYSSSLPSHTYEQELTTFCNQFFTEQMSNEDHFQLLSAFFNWPHVQIFWQIYWERLCALPTEAIGGLLAFWFSLRPMQLHQTYVAHDFLLQLQQNLHHYQKMPDFQKSLTKFAATPWYSAIQESNVTRKIAILTIGQDLVKQFQKRLPNQKENDEVEEQKRLFQNAINKLFEKDAISENHRSILMRVYQKYTPDQFWEAYKERLVQLLLSQQGALTLEFFSFWFDEAFTSFGSRPYLAQSFFIGLAQVFEIARKENEAQLRHTAQRMQYYVSRSNQAYAWFGLIERFFPEEHITEQRGRKLKR